MAEQARDIRRGRLLLLEADAVRRHYYSKYVVGILWRGLSDEEREQRIMDVVRQRGASSQRRADPQNGATITLEARRRGGKDAAGDAA